MKPRVIAKRIVAFLWVNVCTAAVPAQLLPPPPESESDPVERLQTAFESIAERLSPSVVAVAARGRTERDRTTAHVEQGTGFIIHPDGLILTSEHVVRNAITLEVTHHDGTRRRAALIASDARSDLAVLRIDAENLHALPLGQAETLRRGRFVLALGHPVGLNPVGPCALAFGLVSAIARPLPDTLGQQEDRYFGEMIQISTHLGPGYSGGPLVDLQGRVVGVLAAAGLRRAGDDGMAFAVPINERNRRIIDVLMGGTSIDYGYLGADIADTLYAATEPYLASSAPDAALPIIDTPASSGSRRGAALVTVYPNGPADRAGLQPGDVILSVDRLPIRSADHLVQVIGEAGPGRSVQFVLTRRGRPQQCEVVLSQRVAPDDDRTAPPDAPQGFTFRGALLQSVLARVGPVFDAPSGAMLVVMIDADSPADRAGLCPGDIITRVDGRPLPTNLNEWTQRRNDILLGLSNGSSVLVRPMPSSRQSLALDEPNDP